MPRREDSPTGGHPIHRNAKEIVQMADNSEGAPGLPDTPDPGNFPIGSPESRAAARLLLRKVNAVKCYFVRRGPDGPEECDPGSATVRGGDLPDLTYERREGETAKEFEKRIWDDLPAAGPLRVVTMHPRTDGPEAA